jgi:hypothetical protein
MLVAARRGMLAPFASCCSHNKARFALFLFVRVANKGARLLRYAHSISIAFRLQSLWALNKGKSVIFLSSNIACQVCLRVCVRRFESVRLLTCGAMTGELELIHTE